MCCRATVESHKPQLPRPQAGLKQQSYAQATAVRTGRLCNFPIPAHETANEASTAQKRASHVGIPVAEEAMRAGFSMATLGAEDMPNIPSPMQP